MVIAVRICLERLLVANCAEARGSFRYYAKTLTGSDCTLPVRVSLS